ncbi:MAG: M23 family metallopeptidase [Oscillospiraceae bacterium]|nr:M23 family metallopeptidase [Oscillospiraceae bacterium]
MNYTVMLVPHSQKKPIHLKMPAGVLALVVAAGFTLLGLTTYWAYSAYCLKAVEAENAGLKKISTQQEQQIKGLDETASQLLIRMDALSESDTVIREKVGLAPSLEGVGGASDGYIAAEVRTDPTRAGDLSLQRELTALTDKLDYASEVLAQKESAFAQLGEDVDARLYYLASLPDAWPISGARFTSAFGARNDPFETGETESHSGIDLACEYGTPIYAAGRATVVSAGYQGEWGNVIILDHGFGYETIYAHLSSIAVSAGDSVAKGQLLGAAGSTGRSTGTHLHFSVQYDGELIDPLDVLGETDGILDLVR